MKIERNGRGFEFSKFEDCYNQKCSIQKSSSATADRIWFGVDDANPQLMASDARRLGIETEAVDGWVPFPIPKEVVLSTRMHLSIDMVKEIIPVLQRFVDTGDLNDYSESEDDIPEEIKLNQKQQDYIKFMSVLGYEYVYIGYEGHDESEWQLKNAKWLNDMDIDSVGYYFFNTTTNNSIYLFRDEWERSFEPVKDWNYIIECVRALKKLGLPVIFEDDIKVMYNECLNYAKRL